MGERHSEFILESHHLDRFDENLKRVQVDENEHFYFNKLRQEPGFLNLGFFYCRKISGFNDLYFS